MNRVLEQRMRVDKMQKGYVRSLQIQSKKGLPFEKVQVIECIAEKGIIGDCHYADQDRQITLLSMEQKNWIKEQTVKGLCFSKFDANILTENLDYRQIKDGQLLSTDQVVLEVKKYPKRCFQECTRLQENLICELKTGVVYARVIKSGRVQEGDTITSN